MKNIAENFLDTADRLPSKTFLVGMDNRRFTYGEILGLARRFAGYLETHGASPV